MLKLGQKKKEAVGLDIGSYSIKVASVKKEAAEHVLNIYNIKNVKNNGNKSSDIGSLIEEVFSEIDLHPEDVNLSISGPDVIVRFIDLPKMSKDQLANALFFEAEKYIPFNVNEVIMDSLILGDAADPGQMRVLLAAAKREVLEKRIKLVEKAGMSVNLVDIDSFAIFNAYLESYPASDNNGKAFLDFGHSQTNVLISIGSEPSFMRQVQIGGGDITGAICKKIGISAKEAEQMKMNPGEENKETVQQAVASVLDDLIGEIQLSLGYFENRYNNMVGDFFCSGGMIYQEGVMEYLGNKLGVQVKKWSPVSGIRLSEDLSREDTDQVSSQLAVCVGLALRG